MVKKGWLALRQQLCRAIGLFDSTLRFPRTVGNLGCICQLVELILIVNEAIGASSTLPNFNEASPSL
eukprot:scaffold331_cov117-Cylindrotheca_fusiformis.AAC.12